MNEKYLMLPTDVQNALTSNETIGYKECFLLCFFIALIWFVVGIIIHFILLFEGEKNHE